MDEPLPLRESLEKLPVLLNTVVRAVSIRHNIIRKLVLMIK